MRSVQEPNKGTAVAVDSLQEGLTDLLPPGFKMAVNQSAVGGSISEVEAATLNLKPEKPQRSKKRAPNFK